MLNNILCTRNKVLLFILLIVEFFHFKLFPGFLTNVNNRNLFLLIVVVLVYNWLLNKKRIFLTEKRIASYGTCMFLIAVFMIANCISCYYNRGQSPIETFLNWTPIFILLLYYPLNSVNLNVKNWEKILFTLFVIDLLIHLIIILFYPSIDLFEMEVSKERYLDGELRARLFSDAILFLGNVFCFNKALVSKNIRSVYVLLSFISLIVILLLGFRTVIAAVLFSYVFILYKTKRNIIKYGVWILIFGGGLLIFALNNTTVRNRVNEIIERNEESNFNNNDYIRVVVIQYYYSNYFKNYTEMLLGSGMVRRIVSDSNPNNMSHLKYPSNYSKEVSFFSEKYHFYPVDLGLLGLSWEAGILTVIVLLTLCIILLNSRLGMDYLYINAWGLFLILISLTVPFYYYHKNLIYTVIVFIILSKLKRINYLRQQKEKR